MTPTRSRTSPTPGELADWVRAVGEHGDRTAFAGLFEHFAPRVKAYLMRGGSPPWLAEEIAQESMVHLWRSARSFDPARAQASTWLFTIARNLRIDYARRSSELPRPAAPEGADDAEPEAVDPSPTPPDRVVAAQLEDLVRHAIGNLPEEQGLILRLSYFEERPHSVIAEVLGIPLGTVKSRIRLAVQHLRRALGKLEP